jgi:hypothetical protein
VFFLKDMSCVVAFCVPGPDRGCTRLCYDPAEFAYRLRDPAVANPAATLHPGLQPFFNNTVRALFTDIDLLDLRGKGPSLDLNGPTWQLFVRRAFPSLWQATRNLLSVSAAPLVGQASAIELEVAVDNPFWRAFGVAFMRVAKSMACLVLNDRPVSRLHHEFENELEHKLSKFVLDSVFELGTPQGPGLLLAAGSEFGAALARATKALLVPWTRTPATGSFLRPEVLFPVVRKVKQGGLERDESVDPDLLALLVAWLADVELCAEKSGCCETRPEQGQEPQQGQEAKRGYEKRGYEPDDMYPLERYEPLSSLPPIMPMSLPLPVPEPLLPIVPPSALPLLPPLPPHLAQAFAPKSWTDSAKALLPGKALWSDPRLKSQLLSNVARAGGLDLHLFQWRAGPLLAPVWTQLGFDPAKISTASFVSLSADELPPELIGAEHGFRFVRFDKLPEATRETLLRLNHGRVPSPTST